MTFADAQASATILATDGVIENVTLAEGCAKGDLLGYNGAWYRALATTGTAIKARGVALMEGKTGDVIPMCAGKTKMGGRLSGMTVGNPLFGAEGTSYGQYTETVPTTTGDVNTKVGTSISATVAVIDPNAVLATIA